MTAFLAFLAGVVTVLSPCVLPLLPAILASSVQEGRLRPWGVVTGFVGCFSGATLLLSALVLATGISPEILRAVSGALLVALGAILAVPRLSHAFELQAGGVAALSGAIPASGNGFWGGLALGSGLGLAWTPCVGPIMASVITLALNQEVTAGTVLVTLAYAMGTALPMVAVIFGGRSLIHKVQVLRTQTETIRTGMGLLLALAGIAILTDADRAIQIWLLIQFPGWEAALTGWEPSQF
jgi:cytochrome c biogenesis protein CcdA